MPEEYILPANPTTLDYLKRIESLMTLLKGRDIGVIAGVPIEDYGEYKPLPPQLLVLFSDDRTMKKKTSSIRIPNPKPNLTATQIQSLYTFLHQGKRAYTKGPFRATIEFEDRRKIVTFCDTAVNAELLARNAALLSNGVILRIYVTQYSQTPVNRVPQPRIVYPVSAYYYNRDELSDGNHADEIIDLREP